MMRTSLESLHGVHDDNFSTIVDQPTEVESLQNNILNLSSHLAKIQFRVDQLKQSSSGQLKNQLQDLSNFIDKNLSETDTADLKKNLKDKLESLEKSNDNSDEGTKIAGFIEFTKKIISRFLCAKVASKQVKHLELSGDSSKDRDAIIESLEFGIDSVKIARVLSHGFNFSTFSDSWEYYEMVFEIQTENNLT